jgi:hypothetical protein
MKRKKRSDSNHCIYVITCLITGERYVGITIAQGRAYKQSVKVRFQKHISRAKCEQKQWNLYTKMRDYGVEQFKVELIEVLRGKKAAHAKEREMIQSGEYTLNTHGGKYA